MVANQPDNELSDAVVAAAVRRLPIWVNCPARNSEMVTVQTCTQTSSEAPTNSRYCSGGGNGGCKSAGRVCIQCILNGYVRKNDVPEDALVAEFDTHRLCKWHIENGSTAVRPQRNGSERLAHTSVVEPNLAETADTDWVKNALRIVTSLDEEPSRTIKPETDDKPEAEVSEATAEETEAEEESSDEREERR